MGNAQKALVMAAGIFLAIALITIAVVMFVSAQDATKTAQANFSNIQDELSQTAFTVYDNTVVSGSQVVNALRKFASKDEFGILVKTGKDRTGQWYGFAVCEDSGGCDSSSSSSSSSTTEYEVGDVIGTSSNDLADVFDEQYPEYVNPSGKFKADLIIDRNNMVRAIVFDQTY